jgi:hypothetical protein
MLTPPSGGFLIDTAGDPFLKCGIESNLEWLEYIYIYVYIYIGILMKNVFIYPNIPLMGGSINGDTQNSWCVMEISNRKWMMARGTPILGNLHSDIMFHISH